jgi:hypothetical protein
MNMCASLENISTNIIRPVQEQYYNTLENIKRFWKATQTGQYNIAHQRISSIGDMFHLYLYSSKNNTNKHIINL